MKDKLEIRYQAETGIVYIKVLDFIDFEGVKQMWKDAFAMIDKHQSTKVLMDIKNAKVIPLEAQQWVIQELAPILVSKNIKMARTTSDNIFNQASSQRLYQDIKNLNKTAFHNLGVFNNLKEAEEWLVGS